MTAATAVNNKPPGVLIWWKHAQSYAQHVYVFEHRSIATMIHDAKLKLELQVAHCVLKYC